MKYNFTYNEEIKFGILEWFENISLKEFRCIYKEIMKNEIKFIVIDMREISPDIYKTEICKKIFSKIKKVALITNTFNSILYNFIFMNVSNVKCFNHLENACTWLFNDGIIETTDNYQIRKNSHFNYAEISWFKSISNPQELIIPIKKIVDDKTFIEFALFNDLTHTKIDKHIIKETILEIEKLLNDSSLRYIAIKSKDKLFNYYMNLLGNQKIKFFAKRNNAILWLTYKNIKLVKYE